MTNFYWIIAQHSRKVLEVDAQLWYFNGGFIANKRSGFMLDVAGGTQIIQYERYAESCAAQEWDYNHEDNTISLKHDRKFVLDVAVKREKKSSYMKSMVARINNSFYKNGTIVQQLLKIQ
ncbi:Carbohydrate-Binding Module Family 13 protein [Rhizophagus diaphanus]|nr:Carbohydrate-Binding Module Family 13 protein [Rhizophagus diaphanus] [Rhizophagus sp. MUCL 43196]